MDAQVRGQGGRPLSGGGHSRIVAAQAVVVGLLLAVVFVVLLQPSNDADLFDVSAPGAGNGAADSSERPGGEGRSTQRDARPGEASAGDAPATEVRERPSAGPSPQSPSAISPGDSRVPGTLPPPPPAGGGGPTGDQYADTMARLNASIR